MLDGLAGDLSRHVGTADRVAVVAFDGASMETLTPWTHSLHDLDDALERARGRPAHGLHRKVERLANEADRVVGPDTQPVTKADLGENPRGIKALPGAVGREALLHATLEELARATGGLPMIDARREGALARGFEDARHFYWLGFEPRRREGDGRHDLEVRLAGRPELDVRAREGYVDMARDREFEMAVEAARLFGAVPAARPLGVRFAEPVRAGQGRMTVPVELIIPLDEVLLAPVGGEWRSELELRIMLVDAAGGRSAMPARTIAIAGPRPPRPGQVYVYETSLALLRKKHRYVLAVLDRLTGGILTATGSIGP